jgi:chorismate mutase / prephenate dehydrogenase
MQPGNLDELRTDLGAIDREILRLVAQRQATAQKIGIAKRDAGLPTRDYRQERDVLERARAAAVEHGLAPALGEELMLTLIKSSLTVQERDLVAARRDGTGQRVLVIGGLGNMGRWFCRFLAALCRGLPTTHARSCDHRNRRADDGIGRYSRTSCDRTAARHCL